MQYILYIDRREFPTHLDFWNLLMKTTGNMKLKLARIANGLSQQDLADRVEVTRQTIGLIESGNYNPTLNLCVKIARALEMTLDQLFWEDGKDGQ